MCVRYSAKCEQDYKPILAPQQSCFYPPRGQDSCKARHIRGDCGQLEAQLECAVSLSLNNHGTAQTVAKANLGTAVAIPGGNEETKRLPGGSTVFQAMCGHLQRIYPISYGGLCTGTGCVTSDGLPANICLPCTVPYSGGIVPPSCYCLPYFFPSFFLLGVLMVPFSQDPPKPVP